MSSAKDTDIETPLTDNKSDNADLPLDDKKKQGGGNSKAISSCALYAFCSVSMVLVNKSLASR